jgi:hypothetical protein
MDQSEDPRELERKIHQATRIASHINDQTTVERLRAWIQGLRQSLSGGRQTNRPKSCMTRAGKGRQFQMHNTAPAEYDGRAALAYALGT